jgi:co-chaperonin GroES (HSP10)
MYSAEAPVAAEEGRAPTALPDPVGFRILIAVPKVEEKTEGGVFRPDALVEREERATIVGFVMKLGPDAYGDKTRFPSGPWCKQGDFVVFRSYSGTRLTVSGHEFRLINDDTVEATVDDPRMVMRA